MNRWTGNESRRCLDETFDSSVEIDGSMASAVGQEEECDGQMRVSLSWSFHEGVVNVRTYA